jgi:zinc transporter 9
MESAARRLFAVQGGDYIDPTMNLEQQHTMSNHTVSPSHEPAVSSEDREWTWITSVSVIIFVAAMAAGLLPFAFVQVKWMNKVTALGAGLCIGAALGLMLPEGFEMLFEAHEKHGFEPGVGGFVLTLGLVLFFLLEKKMGGAHSHNSSGACDHTALISDSEKLASKKESRSSKQGFNTVVLMVLHAATDGLVIGSAAATDHHEISMVVALAMVAHKVPASFSLSSFLLALRFSYAKVAKYLLLFSLSSPLAAIAFFAIGDVLSEAAFAITIR